MSTIDGPLGPFAIPESANPRTKEICEQLTRAVFEGEYDHPELPTFEAEEPPFILDVGSGWGAFTCWALRRWPGCWVRCYEPHGKAADVLLENLKAQIADGSVLLSRCAVTTNPAPLLNGCEDFGSYGVMGEGGWPVDAKHPQYLPECDILKCDAEGVEVEVLEAYPHLRSCAALLIEWHDLEKKRRVREIASAAGFRCLRETLAPATYGVSIWTRAA